MEETTMDQIHQDLTRVREDLSKMRETMAVQGQMLAQVSAQITQTAQVSAQQTSQIMQLTTDVSVIKSDITTWRNEVSLITTRITDMPNLFVPRKEHEAQRHETRLVALETTIDEVRLASLQRDVDRHKQSLQNILVISLAALGMFAGVLSTVLTLLKH